MEPCKHMVLDTHKVKLTFSGPPGDIRVTVSATVEGLQTNQTNMVFNGVAQVGAEYHANFTLLANNASHGGNVRRCSAAETSAPIPAQTSAAIVVRISHDTPGGPEPLPVRSGSAGDCG